MPLPTIPKPTLPTWSQTKTKSKAGFDRVYNVVDKLGPPINRLSNKVGAEAFWPTTLDKESDKAARILRSFCKDGFYVEEKVEEAGAEKQEPKSPKDGLPKGKQRVVKKIPMEVIQKARGLAIFTTMRTGLYFSGASGSGVLVARKADGSWSDPSGIMLHTAGLGFLIGVDIYDCVVVINTDKALEAFSHVRCTLGGEVSAVAGPVGMGGVLESEVHKRQTPVWTYLKSRGFYAGVQVDGTVIIERTDENERFYGERIPVADILAGKAKQPPKEIKTLINTIRAAQGEHVDESLLPNAEPTPGDYEVKEDDSPGFGMPDEDDPDPYGVKALAQQGMEVKEAGTGIRPSMDVFDFKPSPTSPLYATFHSRKNSKRMSITSIKSSYTDTGTQTDGLPSPQMTESPKERNPSPVKKTSENLAEYPDEEHSSSDHEDQAPVVIAAVQQAQRPTSATIVSKPKIVTIPKRVPPALPPRNPFRTSGHVSPIPSPLASPSIPEHEEGKGLGIEIGTRPALDPRQSQTSIDERMKGLLLTPLSDKDQLAPSRPVDAASMSGSDYSAHDTLAEEPSREFDTNKEALKLDTSKREDLERQDLRDHSGGVEEEQKLGDHSGGFEEEQDHDGFHSVPSTPLDAESKMFPYDVERSTQEATGQQDRKDEQKV